MIRSCSVFVFTALQAAKKKISVATQHGNAMISGDLIEQTGPEGPYSANDPRQGPLRHPYQERIPRDCWYPPPGTSPLECCPIPKLFKDEDMVACGVKKPPENVPNPQRRLPRDCNRTLCLLKARNITNDGVIDYVKLGAFVDEWQEAHPNLSEAIGIARKKCVVEGLPEPDYICEADRVFFCLTSQIIWNCKLSEETTSCKILKEHMDECRPYYERPKDEPPRNK